ncbi:Spherulin-4 [Catenuloplanes sp. NPDC051500]|uniref:Spherulin-4 n=1 Tax=Catenuloplanes sp. NPDC051500 TaxID=3363959 RepID=UPI0037A35D59
MPILLPLAAHRYSPAETWAAVAGPGCTVTAVLDLPPAETDAAVAVLTRAGVRMFGRVDLEHGERPVTALLDDLAGWVRHPVAGLLLDRCPADADELGAVALAVRHARRLGIAEVLLNVGADPHPRYRCLGVGVIGFAGSWLDYQRAETRPGDAHLVFDVPAALLPLARRLITLRGAGWALATPVAAPAHGTHAGEHPRQ